MDLRDKFAEGHELSTLIELLERKNLCYRSFYKLCGEFLDEIARDDTTNLDQFQKHRQSLINILEQLEFEIMHWLDRFNKNRAALDTLMTEGVKKLVGDLLKQKDSLIKSILDLDLQVLSHIDRIKSETIQKLQAVQSGRKTIGAYRSPLDSVDLAEGANKVLDQKA